MLFEQLIDEFANDIKAQTNVRTKIVCPMSMHIPQMRQCRDKTSNPVELKLICGWLHVYIVHNAVVQTFRVHSAHFGNKMAIPRHLLRPFISIT